MIIIELQELIGIIPELINLFLSGFIFMSIFKWLTNLTMEPYMTGVWSLFVNFLIQLFYSTLHIMVWSEINFPEPVKYSIYIASAVIFPFIIVRIFNSTYIRKILDRISKKTIHEDVLDDVIDYNKRCNVIVNLKDSDIYYAGIFKLKEEKGVESRIVLVNYVEKRKSDDKLILDYGEKDFKTSVVINLSDVESLQLFYEDDSETWRFLSQ